MRRGKIDGIALSITGGIFILIMLVCLVSLEIK